MSRRKTGPQRRKGYGDGRARGLTHPRGKYQDRAHAHHSEVTQVLRVVDRSEIPSWLASWRAEDRAEAGKGRGGRRPMLDDRQVLALLLLLSLASQPQTIRAMTALVLWGLDDKSRELLGIDLADLTPDDIYNRLWRSFHRTLRVLDPHPFSKYRKLTKTEFALAKAAISPEFETCRRDRLDKVSNRLLWSSWMELPREVRRRWKGNAVVDGTAIAAYSKSAAKASDYVPVEPYAGPYKLRGQHGLSEADLESLTNAQRKKAGGWLYAWESTLVLSATNDPRREQTFPQLIVGMTLDKPAENPGGHAVKALTQMRANGMPADFLIGDRAYGYAPTMENYGGPVRGLGYRLLFDLAENELAKVRFVDGMVLLEGNLYCPSILAHPKLLNATRDLRLGNLDADGAKISWDEYGDRLAQRARFMVQANGRPRPDGAARVMCPAAGPNPTVACPLRESKAAPDKVFGLWPISKKDLPSQDHRGPVCSNAGGTVTVQPNELFPRYHQDMQFGTREWGELFGVARQSIESMNYQLKNASKGNARAGERRRVRGLAAQTLFVAALAVGVNLRKIEMWLAAEPPVLDSRERGRPLERRRDRRRDSTYGVGLRKYRNIPPDAPPGEAA